MRKRAAVTAAVLAAGLLAPSPSPARARPTCMGHRATIVGTNRHDVLRGTDGRDVIVGLDGADVIRGLGGDDLICGGDGYLYGDHKPEVLLGGDGDDEIAGGPSYEKSFGGPGNDVLRPNRGGGSADGGPGDDVHWGGPDNDSLGGTSMDETGFGMAPDRPTAGSAQAHGDPGLDRIVGNGGDDMLFAGPGDEVMDGGEGSDQVSFYSMHTSEYTADLVTDLAVGDGTDVLVDVEELAAWVGGDFVLRGDDGPNVLVGAPTSYGSGELHGLGGDDVLVPWRRTNNGGEGNGPVDIYGGDGDDTMDDRFATCFGNGQPAPVISGGGGDDYLMPWCGAVPSGGDGDDFLFGPSGPYSEEQTLDGGEGFDIAAWPHSGRGAHLEADLEEGKARVVDHSTGTGQDIHLAGIEGIEGTGDDGDVIRGDDGPNVLRGSSDADYLVRTDQDGGDTIEGRGGDDVIFGDEGDDLLDGGDGTDEVDGDEGRDACLDAEIVRECESTSALPRLLRLL